MVKLYQNEKHKKRVKERGDGYTYIGSYRCNETTMDGKYNKSLSYIRVKCPYCGSEYDVQLSSFVGKLGAKCTNCCNTYENSFAYYIQQELKEPLNKYWDWEKNNELGINPYCVNPRSDKKIYIKCDKTDYHESYLISLHNFHNGNRCPYCVNQKIHPKDSFGQYLINEFGENAIEKYWSPKNTINPFNIAPQSSIKKVWILCQEREYHNDNEGYKISPANFRKGSRCPYCVSKKIHPRDSFGVLYAEKAKHWSPNNKKSPFEISPRSLKKYKFICEKCGKEFERALNNMTRFDNGVVCLECNSSQLEYKTKEILIKYNIEYKIQVEYNGLIGLKGGNLSYDFYLPNYNFLIECQGIQHEKFTKGLHKTKKDFEKQLEHDKRKKQYAKEHNINLLEIWYYDIDNIEDILIEKLQIKNN